MEFNYISKFLKVHLSFVKEDDSIVLINLNDVALTHDHRLSIRGETIEQMPHIIVHNGIYPPVIIDFKGKNVLYRLIHLPTHRLNEDEAEKQEEKAEYPFTVDKVLGTLLGTLAVAFPQNHQISMDDLKLSMDYPLVYGLVGYQRAAATIEAILQGECSLPLNEASEAGLLAAFESIKDAVDMVSYDVSPFDQALDGKLINLSAVSHENHRLEALGKPVKDVECVFATFLCDLWGPAVWKLTTDDGTVYGLVTFDAQQFEMVSPNKAYGIRRLNFNEYLDWEEAGQDLLRLIKFVDSLPELTYDIFAGLSFTESRFVRAWFKQVVWQYAHVQGVNLQTRLAGLQCLEIAKKGEGEDPLA